MPARGETWKVGDYPQKFRYRLGYTGFDTQAGTMVKTNTEVQFVNLCPHAINFVAQDGAPVLDLPAATTPCRVAVTNTVTGTCGPLPVITPIFGEVQNLPQPIEGTIYIVSLMVASAVPSRTDLAVVCDTVRNSAGAIIGAKGISFPNRK